MNDELAHKRLSGVLATIDGWGDLYERRWDHPRQDHLESAVKQGIDEVRARTKLAHDVIAAMGEDELAAQVVEHEEGM
jgi:hypothetical protein